MKGLFEPFFLSSGFLEKAATTIFGGYCMALFSSQKKNGIIDSKNTSFGASNVTFTIERSNTDHQ